MSENQPMDALVQAPRLWHELKTDPDVFDAVVAGLKTHEIRYNDRDFKVGDGLLLRRTRDTGWAMKNTGAPLEYTGEECRRVVSHVLEGYGLQPGWVILSFARSLATPAEVQTSDEWDAADRVIAEAYPDIDGRSPGWWGAQRIPNWGQLRGAIARALLAASPQAAQPVCIDMERARVALSLIQSIADSACSDPLIAAHSAAAELRLALATPTGEAAGAAVQPTDLGARYRVEFDGFVGTVIGSYRRLDGEEGVVMQQDGCKVVHVYRRKWLAAAPQAAGAVQPSSLSGVASKPEAQQDAVAPCPEGWATKEMEALFTADSGSRVTMDMKRAAGIALQVMRGQRWDDSAQEWTGVAAPAGASDQLAKALQRLCRHFPTDTDMAAAGWSQADINAACNAYDAARAALSGAPAVAAEPLTAYRLLERGEQIQKGDEVLADDTVNWLPLVGWETRMQWGGNLMPMRRRTDQAAHGIGSPGVPPPAQAQPSEGTDA